MGNVQSRGGGSEGSGLANWTIPPPDPFSLEGFLEEVLQSLANFDFF